MSYHGMNKSLKKYLSVTAPGKSYSVTCQGQDILSVHSKKRSLFQFFALSGTDLTYSPDVSGK